MSIFDLLKFKPKPLEKDSKNFVASSTSGTEIFSGQFFEEYLQEVTGRRWALIADRMRRSSDQINMLLTLVKTPIISANWNVDYAEESAEDEKMKDFIEFNLFNRIDFKQFLEEAITCFEFGHSIFEVIYQPLINHGTFPQTICLKRLSFINPKTIEEWYLHRDGTLKEIRQVAYGDLSVDVKINAEKLIVFSIGREGSNYEGRSLLRPIYGNWKRKEQYLKIEAIGSERASVGTPIGILPAGANKAAEDVLLKILSSFTSHQRSSVVVDNGTEIKNFDIGFQADKIRATIDAERLGMSQSFLAGFMELSTNSSSGSFALSTNLMNIFLGSIQIYADKIAERINKDIIVPLIDINFGKQDYYPILKASNIIDKIGKEFVENLVALTTAGYVQTTDEMREFLHRKLNLPEGELEVMEDTTPEAKEEKPVEKKVKKELSLEFADKPNAIKLIENDAQALEKLMRDNLTIRRDKLLDNTRKLINRKAIRKEVISQRLPDTKEYRDLIFNALADTTLKATKQVKSELGMPNLELATKEELASLLPKTRERLRAEIDLIIDSQEADLSKNLFFSYNNNLNNTDSTDKIIEGMKKGSDKYLLGAALVVGAANFISNAVNNARNDIFQDPAASNEIESYTIVNPAPETAICKAMAGRTISKAEYLSGDLPPYHHNCKSIVVANLVGGKNNPKLSPLGMSYTGTAEEVESIIKSKTF